MQKNKILKICKKNNRAVGRGNLGFNPPRFESTRGRGWVVVGPVRLAHGLLGPLQPHGRHRHCAAAQPPPPSRRSAAATPPRHRCCSSRPGHARPGLDDAAEAGSPRSRWCWWRRELGLGEASGVARAMLLPAGVARSANSLFSCLYNFYSNKNVVWSKCQASRRSDSREGRCRHARLIEFLKILFCRRRWRWSHKPC